MGPRRLLHAACCKRAEMLIGARSLPRRICVGRHLARNSLFLNMACLLWMFNIRAPLGPDGKEIVCTEEAIDKGLVM